MLGLFRRLLLYYLHYLHSLCCSSAPRSLGPVSLPVEILSEAFAYLDFSDVFAVKLTCKTFYSVTKTRQFWYSRINALTQAHYVCLPEDELENYTVRELEEWTIRRSRALDVCIGIRKPHFRKRTVELPSGKLHTLQSSDLTLIPGGRWLLIHPSAVVYYMDLDCPEPTLRTLFDLHGIDDQIPYPQFTIFATWVDKASPRLSFRLASLVHTDNGSRTYTSQINMTGRGVDATLAVSNITMFRSFSLDLWPAGLTLNDRYLAQVWCTDSFVGQIGIYEHGLALGCPVHPMNHDNDHAINVAAPEIMEFIHDDILAIQCIKTASFSIFEVESSSSLKLLHRIDIFAHPSSTLRWTPDATVIAMMDRRRPGDIQGLIIPHDTGRSPIVVALGTVETYHCVLGTRLVIPKGAHEIFRYGWDLAEPTKQPSALVSIFDEIPWTGLRKFDEDTGRFVTYPGLRLDIYDIISYC